MLVLERPIVLLALLVTPIVVYLRAVWPRRGGRVVFPIAVWGGAGLPVLVSGRRIVLALCDLLVWLAWLALLLAAALPVRTERERVVLSRGVDMVVVLDQSASMAAEDFVPGTRFEAAQQALTRFVAQRPHDAIGFVGFSAEAALHVPPTLDHDQVVAALRQAQLLQFGDGTAIGMGLALATLHLQHSSAAERVIVLLTDGVNNAGSVIPADAARAAAELGIRVYTIGLGTPSEAAIEVTDPSSGRLYRGRVVDSFDPAALQQIATATGGAYFASASLGSLQSVLDAISGAQTVERRLWVRVRRRPRHSGLIGFALMALALQLVVRHAVVRVVT